MMKPLYKQPLVEAVILASGILCTVVLIHGVQNFIALGGKPVTSQIAQKSNPDLVNVAAGSCEGLGDVDKRPPNGTQVPADVPTDKINNFGLVIKDGLTEAPPSEKVFGNNISSANIDPAHIMLDGLVDGPITLANVWSVTDANESKTSAAVRKNEVIAIRTTVGQVIKTPDSGRKILDGSNLSGMVMYVSEDGVRFANSRNDKPTAQEGYNLYIWGITPDPGLVSRYKCANDTLGRQKMPEMHVGDPLGTANSEFVYLALRDNGAFQDLLDTSWWNGRIKAGETTGAAAPLVGGAVVPAGAVPESVVSGKIFTNSVETAHPTLFQDFDTKKKIIVAGDSNTKNITFSLPEFSITNNAVGGQGAKKLASQVKEFPDKSKFALILIGVNEVHNGEKDAANGALSQFQANLDDIVKQTIAKGIIPVLQTVDDFDTTGDIKKNLGTVNQFIRGVAISNNIPLVVTTDYVDISFMEPDEHPYHFNLTKGAQLRNQILRLVNDKLDGVAPAKPAGGPAAPAATTHTISGNVNITGGNIGSMAIFIRITNTDTGKEAHSMYVSSVDAYKFITPSNLPNGKYDIAAELYLSKSAVSYTDILKEVVETVELKDKDIIKNINLAIPQDASVIVPKVTVEPNPGVIAGKFSIQIVGETNVTTKLHDFLSCVRAAPDKELAKGIIFAYFGPESFNVFNFDVYNVFRIRTNVDGVIPTNKFSGFFSRSPECSFFVRDPNK